VSAAIERILIAMDPSPPAVAACRAAASLAAALRAELVGMFIEDAALIASAELPVTREIGAHTGRQRPLSSADLEAQLRAAARRTREALEVAASAASITATFRVARIRARLHPPRALVAGPVRAIVDDPETEAAVLDAAAALAEAAGVQVARISGDITAGSLDPGGPIVLSATSELAREPGRLARLASETGAAIALVKHGA
jgi:hypothetical protein